MIIGFNVRGKYLTVILGATLARRKYEMEQGLRSCHISGTKKRYKRIVLLHTHSGGGHVPSL